MRRRIARVLIGLSLLTGAAVVPIATAPPASAAVLGSSMGTWCPPNTARCVAINMYVQTAMINGVYSVRGVAQAWSWRGSVISGAGPLWQARIPLTLRLIGGGTRYVLYGCSMSSCGTGNYVVATPWVAVGGSKQYQASAGTATLPALLNGDSSNGFPWQGIKYSNVVQL